MLKIGSNTNAVAVTAVDANGNNYAGTLYIYASSAADALIAGSETPASCSWTASVSAHLCSITGVTPGTAKFKVINKSTVALSTVTSNEVSVTVSNKTAATVKLAFDKATYAPNEKAKITVTVLDADGKVLPTGTYGNLFTSGGISSNASLTGDTLTAVSVTTAASASATTVGAGSAYAGTTANAMTYTVFMPSAGGTVTISAKGGTSLPEAGQVAVTASATVRDDAAAALAAVNALATTVASLKTLITTLTNLVLKIQKKVKA
jgi:membrane-bound inhibitor of C-type lysozyme